MNHLAQPDLFDARLLARRSDPHTSKIAAVRVKEFGSGHVARILETLSRCGSATIDEIAKRTDLTAVQTARRLPEMQARGLVEPTGGTRLSASGRPERVWKLITPGAGAVAFTKEQQNGEVQEAAHAGQWQGQEVLT